MIAKTIAECIITFQEKSGKYHWENNFVLDRPTQGSVQNHSMAPVKTCPCVEKNAADPLNPTDD